LTAAGLQRNSLIIAGYSGAKSISNDGVTFEGNDPSASFQKETACEETLASLAKICSSRFHFALIDGNHDAKYLESEIRNLKPLLHPPSLLVLDDVDEAWVELKAVFENIRDEDIEILGTDGRVGILRVSGA
jgi:hypothetical protein